jgi:hypothetical protein
MDAPKGLYDSLFLILFITFLPSSIRGLSNKDLFPRARGPISPLL